MRKIFKMMCSIFLWFMLFNNNISLLLTEDIHTRDLRKLVEMIQRRRYVDSDYDILDIPRSVEDLPEAEPIHPGHTLLQPARGMLKSSVKFPHKHAGDMAVYGKLNNLGITFGNTQQRVLYTNFRKTDPVLISLLEKVLRNIKKKKQLNKSNRNPVVIIEIDPENLKQMQNDYPFQEDSELSDVENNASETLDRSIEENEDISPSLPTRRSRKRGRHSKSRNTDSSESSDSSDASSGSSDYERNPGNPYTVHRDKYKQNWMWNHFMDGDHMNINPHAPQFSGAGPSGADLFFGRKWWYYNQDDYQPLS